MKSKVRSPAVSGPLNTRRHLAKQCIDLICLNKSFLYDARNFERGKRHKDDPEQHEKNAG